jgi:hypothetical protein
VTTHAADLLQLTAIFMYVLLPRYRNYGGRQETVAQALP